MVFGLIKSKIEKKLTDSFLKNTFKKEIGNFKKIVLENESISKAFHIYNELNENKNFSDGFAEDFLNDCVDLYNRIELDEKSYNRLNEWIKNVKCENNYEIIDNVLNKDSVLIEDRLKSKKIILESLKSEKKVIGHSDVSLPKMIEIANKNIEKRLSELSESDVNEITKYKTLTEEEVKMRYDVISEMVIEKLDKLSQSSDSDTKSKINETISVIKKQNIDVLNLLKLKNLNETL